MGRFARIAAVLAPLMLAACVPERPQLVVQTPFDPSVGAWINNPGTGSITGQGFLRQQGGGVVTCAGADAIAVPVTPYTHERSVLLFQNGERGFNPFVRAVANPNPPGYLEQRKLTQCDAQGRFTIRNLPAGEYFVATTVSWVIANQQQGGHIMRRVRLGQGEQAEVMLSFP